MQETRAIQTASAEIQATPVINEAVSKLNDNTFSCDDADTLMPDVERWRTTCRDGSLKVLRDSLRSWFSAEVHKLVKQREELADDVDTSTLEPFQKLKKYLVGFNDPVVQPLLDKVGNNIEEMFAASARRSVLTLGEEENLEILCGPELVTMIDSLPTELSEDMKVSLDDAAQKLLDRCLVSAGAFMDDTEEAKLPQIFTNVGILQGRLELKGANPKLMSRIFEKAVYVKVALAKFESSAAKTNQVGLNRAVQNFKQVAVLGVNEDTEFMVSFLRNILKSISPAYTAQSKVVCEKIKEATAEFKVIVDEAAKFAGGTRNGSSWKTEINQKWGLKRILENAFAPGGLCTGPGETVRAMKGLLKEALVAQLACKV